MPKPTPVRVRELTAEEAEAIERLTRSRTEAARKVERAKIIWLAHEGKFVPAIADELHLDPDNVRARIKRFNATGLAALDDAPRSGRPAIYTAEEVGQVVATALTNPTELGLPFAMWTLDRLQAYLSESKGVRMKRSRIDQILIAEGLRWRKQETWFGERVDPESAEKRGPTPSSTRSRPPKA
jgi:transposase